jgi:hypothetical protein
MSDQRAEDEEFSADMLQIQELADGLGLDRWPGDSDTILEIGDLENTRILAMRQGLFTFETTSRGQRSTEAVFSAARDSRRYMIMDVCGSYRFPTRMAPMVMKQLAPGCELKDGPTGYRLSWPDGVATFYHRYEAVTFSWVIDAEPATIVASYQHPTGEPLFDLGIPAVTEVPEPPRPRVMDPPPIETPPPDDEEVDHVTIAAVLAKLGWELWTPSGADVLAVGEPRVGRTISFRQSRFVYETVIPPDYRSARGTFSTAAAARRFMIMELGFVLRLRTRLPKIQPNRLAPGCTIEKGPAGFKVGWPAGNAIFPIGYIGHQNALNFSWVARGRTRRHRGQLPKPQRQAAFRPQCGLSLSTPPELLLP